METIKSKPTYTKMNWAKIQEQEAKCKADKDDPDKAEKDKTPKPKCNSRKSTGEKMQAIRLGNSNFAIVPMDESELPMDKGYVLGYLTREEAQALQKEYAVDESL